MYIISKKLKKNLITAKQTTFIALSDSRLHEALQAPRRATK